MEMDDTIIYPTTVSVGDNTATLISTVFVFLICASPILDEYQYQHTRLSKIYITTWVTNLAIALFSDIVFLITTGHHFLGGRQMVVK